MSEPTHAVGDAPFAFIPSKGRKRRKADELEDVILRRSAEIAETHRRLDPTKQPPDEKLKSLLPPEFCLENSVLAWAKIGEATLVATSRTGDDRQLRDMLEDWIGPVILANAAESDIQALIAGQHAEELARLAATQVEDDLSCRDINKLTWKRGIAASVFFGVSLALIFYFPDAFFIGVTLAAIANLLA